MNTFFAHLKSDVPCTIYANGEYVGVCSKRNSLDLKIDTKDVYFNVSQVGNYCPYTLHIFNNNHCVDTTNNCLIVPFYNNNYDIYLKSIKMNENSPTTTLLNQTIENTKIVILNGILSSINIYDNGSIVYSENVKLLDKANVSKVNGNIILKGFTTTNEYFLLVLNSDFELIYSGYFDNLDESNNLITGFTNVYDIAKHGHICEINLDDLSKINDYYVIKDNGKRCECNELIPQAFLEALKVKNFTLAKSYLCPTLANASNSHFEAFFGPIQAIYYNCYNNSSPLNYTVYNGEYKFYNFMVKNKKITDIEECTH